MPMDPWPSHFMSSEDYKLIPNPFSNVATRAERSSSPLSLISSHAFLLFIKERMGNRIANKIIQTGRAHYFDPFRILKIADTVGII